MMPQRGILRWLLALAVLALLACLAWLSQEQRSLPEPSPSLRLRPPSGPPNERQLVKVLSDNRIAPEIWGEQRRDSRHIVPSELDRHGRSTCATLRSRCPVFPSGRDSSRPLADSNRNTTTSAERFQPAGSNFANRFLVASRVRDRSRVDEW
jgi:hypothetical protein